MHAVFFIDLLAASKAHKNTSFREEKRNFHQSENPKWDLYYTTTITATTG